MPTKPANTPSIPPRDAGDSLSELRSRGGVDKHYQRCLEVLERFSGTEIEERKAFIERATQDLGLHADRLRASGESAGAFSMDLFPRILRPAEWESVQAGVIQRAEAFGAFVRDIYSQRKILHDGMMPPEIVLEDPSFHRELHGVPMSENNPITIGAVDLIRTPSGEWRVLENRFSNPTGISYLIQLRRILAQALPEAFEQFPVMPVASFATRLSEALAAQAEGIGSGDPLVVLLSEGETGRHFFEESFLARHMGIPLALPADILVREGRVHLKTIEGLLPIDVIYRRPGPAQLDPVCFATGGESGVPGLIQCVRRGTVRIANALGCGVADNRALLRYSDTIIRRYTGQLPLLRTVETYHGYDCDQVEWIQEHAGQLMLKTVCPPAVLGRVHPEAFQLFSKGDLQGILNLDPRLVVAQKLPEVARLPVLRDGTDAEQPVVMRAFVLTGRRPYVLPGGLTRLLHPGHERLRTGSRHHALKDTWVLRQDSRAGGHGARAGRLETDLSTRESPLTSRAAESFYWAGRYLERARGTSRMLSVLEELRWGELSPTERELYSPLLAAIIEATSQKIQVRKGGNEAGRLILSLVAEPSNPASIASCLNAARYNAAGIRSFITPEFWRSVMDACSLAGQPIQNKLAGPALRDRLDRMVDACDRIYGTAERTLLHDAGWCFLRTGMLLERAVTHATMLDKVIPRIAYRQWEHLRDDSDLTALLRLLGALDAYHRRYRSRAYLDRVAQMLWQSDDCSASTQFAVSRIAIFIESLAREGAAPNQVRGLLDATRTFRDWLAQLPIASIFPARAVELDRGLTRKNLSAKKTEKAAKEVQTRMSSFLENLHEQLEDTFFSHHPDAARRRNPA